MGQFLPGPGPLAPAPHSPAAAPTYQQALTGALSFVGAAPLFSAQRTLTGSLSFVGVLTKRPSRLLAAALSFTGAAILAAVTRLLAGGFTPTGTLKRASARSLAGALSFSGSLKRSTARLLLASITPSGLLTASKQFVRSLVGATLHPTATLLSARAYLRSLAGALSFIGGANLYPDDTLYPEPELYPYGGAIFFRLFRTLPAVFQPAASLVGNSSSRTRLFTATLQPQVIFLKTSARVILSAALMTTAFSAQKISSTVAKALFAGLRNAGALSSIHNAGDVGHGGGGWGVPMPDSYFQRYKPTLRRQKMRV